MIIDYHTNYLLISNCEHLYTSRSFGSFLGLSIQVYAKEERHQHSVEEIAYPISLGRFIRSLPHNLEFIILMSEKLFTSGKHLRQLLIFSADAPSYSPQGQSVQNPKNLRATSQTLQLMWQMLKFITSQLEKD